MPICIECRYPVPQLYHVSHGSKKAASTAAAAASSTGIDGGGSGLGGEAKRSKASVGGDVRLTQCPRCKRFADKYVEHDFVVLFIDLVLVKPQVYRHLLFNRLGRDNDAFDPRITRLGILLLLFDVYLTWSSIEALPAETTASSPLPGLPILIQYAYYLLLCAARTLAQHLVIRLLTPYLTPTAPPPPEPSSTAFAPLSPGFGMPSSVAGTPATAASSQYATTTPFSSPGPGSTPGPQNHYFAASHTPINSNSTSAAHPSSSPPSPPPGNPGPNAVSTALFVSSCMKLFPILMVVWKYEDKSGQLARGVSWVVAVQNVEALRILLGCSYWASALLVAAGALARWAVSRAVLGVVGLGGVEV